jgi:hypothetical protein
MIELNHRKIGMPEEALKDDKSGINREQTAKFIETRVEYAESFL